MGVLQRINSPRELKKLSQEELIQLAQELRAEIISVVAQNGGHLAPSLGVVELTIALHTVFDSPRDKIIWDVGHQAYAHKLLTGRRKQWKTLRRYGGLSGFPRRSESPHDPFGTGHSSTSISAALGMAVARDLRGERYKIVAVIGDGALTGGMAFEALNHCGHLGKDVLVILNDNEMSISRNVGALSNYLTRLRVDPTFVRAKEDIELLLQRIPSIGPTMARVAHRLKDSLKYLLIPGMLFEELGFKYYGPIDGHDLPLLISTLRDAKERHDPVLIHVLTRKGKGYPPAEANASRFHGTGPFAVETGLPEGCEDKPTYTAVFGRTLAELGRQDPRIIGITAAMPEGTGLNFFAEACPDRFFDVGIAEQHAVTFAAGLAALGMRPVVAIYSTFLQRAYDQIVHDVCLQELPVVFALDRAGLVGEDGPTHHGAFDLSYLRAVPNLVVMAPKDEPELQHMLYTALHLPGPSAIRYPRGQGPGAPLAAQYEELPVGKGELLRTGKDVALVAVGSQVYPALEAANLLAQSGVEAAVINARFVKPLDEELLCRVAEKCKRVVTVEENALCGGFGSAVLELFQRKGLGHMPVLCLGLPDQFIPHGKRSELLALVGLTGQGIAGSVLSWLGKGEVARVGSGCGA